jgi:hypothetical protein
MKNIPHFSPRQKISNDSLLGVENTSSYEIIKMSQRLEQMYSLIATLH